MSPAGGSRKRSDAGNLLLLWASALIRLPSSSKFRIKCGILFAFFMFIRSMNHTPFHDVVVPREAQTKDFDAVEACTFEQLSQFKRKSSAKKDCWSLEDEILRVSARSIVNRDTLPKLGNGCLGGVYKAIIQLPDHSFCAAALKTDNCYRGTANPYARHICDADGKNCICNRFQAHSCIESKAGWNYNTFVGGEYTGALPWYAQLQTGTIQKGLLPTWAVVHAPDRPIKQWIPFFFQTSIPHPDKSAVGVLLPLQKFTNLRALTDKERAMDAVKIAKLMLPAAEGLAFMARMGLAIQDMVDKNVGIVLDVDEPYSMLFDKSYVAIQNDFNCAAGDVSCQFCRESTFSIAKRKKAFIEGLDAIHSDLRRFRDLILKELLAYSPDHKSEELRQKLLVCHDAQQLVEVLQQFVAAYQ